MSSMFCNHVLSVSPTWRSSCELAICCVRTNEYSSSEITRKHPSGGFLDCRPAVLIYLCDRKPKLYLCFVVKPSQPCIPWDEISMRPLHDGLCRDLPIDDQRRRGPLDPVDPLHVGTPASQSVCMRYAAVCVYAKDQCILPAKMWLRLATYWWHSTAGNRDHNRRNSHKDAEITSDIHIIS